MNVLVVPSGTEIGLDIFDALVRRRDIALFGAESTDNSHAQFVYRSNHRVAHFDAPSFVSDVNALVQAYAIDYIFPAHDDVQLALMAAQSAIPCDILSSPLSTVSITRFKSATYEALEGRVPVPRRYMPDEIPERFPVFIKPDRGQGSQGVLLCHNEAERRRAASSMHGTVVCEYLPGREVTVDCFSDREHGLLYAAPRERVRVRAGISVRSQGVEVMRAREYAESIARRFQFYGAWFFQLKERAADDWVLLEVGARIPGGATLARVNGVNLPLMTIFEHRRLPVDVSPTAHATVMDRSFVSRFHLDLDFDDLFVDFDDTLCIRGVPNFQLIALLFAAKHYGKRIVLLSRNAGDAVQWLHERHLIELFDDLVFIDRSAVKAEYVRRGGLLIDDSFADRQACIDAGIPCFDTDAVPAVLEHLERSMHVYAR